MEYKLGNKTFKNKKSVYEYAWDFIRNHKGRITNKSDERFICELLQSHVNYESKVGCGIDYFYVAKSPETPNKCFYIMRQDGTYTDFGVSGCLSPKSVMNEQCMRKMVLYQIDAYKSRFNGGKHFISEYSGNKFPIYDMHCDHIIPFKYIVKKFCKIHNIDLSGNIMETKDNGSFSKFSDKELIEKWRGFHSNFPLRVVSSNENLSVITKESNKLGKEYYNKQIDLLLEKLN